MNARETRASNHDGAFETKLLVNGVTREPEIREVGLYPKTHVLSLESEPFRVGAKENVWSCECTVQNPDFSIDLKGFSEGKRRRGILGTGDQAGAKIFRLPGAYTMVVLHGIDCLSPADKRAGIKVWQPLVKKYGSAFAEAASEMGITQEIPWEKPDIAGAVLANYSTTQRQDKSGSNWEDFVARRLENFFRGRRGMKEDAVYRLKEETNIVTSSFYFEQSRFFGEFVQKLLKKAPQIDKNLFYWYLNGPTASVALLIPELPTEKYFQDSWGRITILTSFFQSAADISIFGWNDNYYDIEEFRTRISDNNLFMDRVLNRLQPHISPQEFHKLMLEKARIGGYAVLDPLNRRNIRESIALALAGTVADTKVDYAANTSNIAVCSDGALHKNRDLDREEAVKLDEVPEAIRILVDENPALCRTYLNGHGFTSDDRVVITARIDWNKEFVRKQTATPK